MYGDYKNISSTKYIETDQDDNEVTDNTVNMGISNDTNTSYGMKNLDRKTSKLQESKIRRTYGAVEYRNIGTRKYEPYG